MKKVLLTAIASTVALGVFAQGTVTFNNRVTGAGTSHVYFGGSTQVQGNAPTGDTTPGTANYAGMTLIGTAGGLSAATTFAQLLSAPGSNQAESSLVPSLNTTTFRTGSGAGNLAGVTGTLANSKDAAVATLEMVAWDNTSGQYATWNLASVAWQAGLIAAGRSAPFNVNLIGGDINTPPNIEPALQSFNIYVVPEPASFALAGLGAAAMVIFRRRKA